MARTRTKTDMHHPRRKDQGKVLQDMWLNCYKGSWKGVIVPEAFAHPAKFAPVLIERMYDHAIEEGWLKPGDVTVTVEVLELLKKEIQDEHYMEL